MPAGFTQPFADLLVLEEGEEGRRRSSCWEFRRVKAWRGREVGSIMEADAGRKRRDVACLAGALEAAELIEAFTRELHLAFK